MLVIDWSYVMVFQYSYLFSCLHGVPVFVSRCAWPNVYAGVGACYGNATYVMCQVTGKFILIASKLCDTHHSPFLFSQYCSMHSLMLLKRVFHFLNVFIGVLSCLNLQRILVFQALEWRNKFTNINFVWNSSWVKILHHVTILRKGPLTGADCWAAAFNLRFRCIRKCHHIPENWVFC